MYFPDQPSEITFVPAIDDRVFIFLDDKKLTSVNRIEILQALIKEAKTFFLKVIELNANPNGECLNQLAIINKMED